MTKIIATTMCGSQFYITWRIWRKLKQSLIWKTSIPEDVGSHTLNNSGVGTPQQSILTFVPMRPIIIA